MPRNPKDTNEEGNNNDFKLGVDLNLVNKAVYKFKSFANGTKL